MFDEVARPKIQIGGRYAPQADSLAVVLWDCENEPAYKTWGLEIIKFQDAGILYQKSDVQSACYAITAGGKLVSGILYPVQVEAHFYTPVQILRTAVLKKGKNLK